MRILRRKLINFKRKGMLLGKKGRKGKLTLRAKIYDGDRRDKYRSVMSFLCGMMMRSGNRRSVECKINRIFFKVRREVRCSMEYLLRLISRRLLLRVGLFKRKISGTNRSIPALLPEYKGMRGGWKRLVRGVNERFERGIEKKFQQEILDMIGERGNSLRILRENKMEIRRGKVWLKYLRR